MVELPEAQVHFALNERRRAGTRWIGRRHPSGHFRVLLPGARRGAGLDGKDVVKAVGVGARPWRGRSGGAGGARDGDGSPDESGA